MGLNGFPERLAGDNRPGLGRGTESTKGVRAAFSARRIGILERGGRENQVHVHTLLGQPDMGPVAGYTPREWPRRPSMEN